MKGKLHKLRNDLVNNIQKMPKGPQLRLQNWKQLYTIDKLPYQNLKKKVLKKDGIDQTKTVKTQTSMKKTKEKPRVNKKNGEITLRKAEEGKVKDTIAVLQEKGFLLWHL